MNQVTDITDVEFKEVPVVVVPDPVSFLTQALRDMGYHAPEAWMEGLHPAAKTSPNIGERLFLVNRSLGLYLSEVRNMGDNIVPRMFISGATSYTNWTQIIKEGVCAWLMGQFDLKTGKRIAPPTVFTPGEDKEDDSAIGLNLVATDDPHKTVGYTQPVLTDEQKVKLVIMAYTPGTVDEVTLSPTLKVRNVSSDGSNMFVFQDTSNSEEWFPLAHEAWETTIPATWPISNENKEVFQSSAGLADIQSKINAAGVISVNSTVILKSGGPMMLVTTVNSDDITCTWPDADGVTQEAVFPKSSLVYPRGMNPSIVHLDDAAHIPDQVIKQKQSRLTTAILGEHSFTGEQPVLDMKFGGQIGFTPLSYQNSEAEKTDLKGVELGATFTFKDGEITGIIRNEPDPKLSGIGRSDLNDPLFIGVYSSQESYEGCVNPVNFKPGSWAIVDGKRVEVNPNQTSLTVGNEASER